MSNGTYWVYILASEKHGTLYVGITNSLQKRIWQHREGAADSFTKRYSIHRLVYFEDFRDARSAIAREKQLKAGSRAKKIALIERENAGWLDLSEGWYEPSQPS